MESFDMLHEEDHRQHNPQKKKGQTTIYKTLLWFLYDGFILKCSIEYERKNNKNMICTCKFNQIVNL
jgi:hypothetical protein